jgi:hypothetical protein
MSLLAAEIGRQVSQLARRADTSDIDGWWSRIVKQLVELLAAAWRTIRRLTGDYLTEHAAMEGHTVGPVLAEWNTEQVLTSMRVTGPVTFKNAISKGRSESDALRSMASAMTGAAGRIVLNGGRDTIAATVAESIDDDNGEIVGWRRVSDGDPCPWCAMLIGRGAVYGSQASAERVVGRAGVARAPGKRAIGTEYHDWCGCTAEPLYEFEEEPAEVDEIYDQWKTVTAGKSFKEALKAWRQYWNSDERKNRDAAQDIEPEREPDLEVTEQPEPVAEPEPVHEPEPSPIDVARSRQQRIDTARSKADVLAQVEELLLNDSDAEVIERHLEILDRRHNLDGDPDLAPLLNVNPGDHSAIRRLLETIAEALGLDRIGGDRQLKVRSRFGEFDIERGRFSRREHDIAGGERAPRDGADVDLIRPGYAVEIDGERVVLSRAIVEEASDDEVLSEKAVLREFHSSLRGIEDLAEMAKLARGRDRERLYGGQSADVRLIRLDDGREIVAKRASDWGDPDMAESVVDQADAEQLAALLAQAIEASVARVYRNKVDAVWMEFIDDADHEFTAADLDSRDGILLGLLDALAANSDRNGGNLFKRRRNHKLVGIDHGSAWGSHLREEGVDRPQLNADDERPVKHFITPDREWADNPLTPEDVAELRRRITRLRPDFERLGRGDWLAYTLSVLSKLSEFAKGTVRLYE